MTPAPRRIRTAEIALIMVAVTLPLMAAAARFWP